jgi:O-antigen ligase
MNFAPAHGDLASDHDPWVLPVGAWLLYAYTLVAPFFTFAVLFSRDTPSVWVIGGMAIVLAFEFVRSGGSFWADKSLLYLFLLLAVYLAGTLAIMEAEPGIRWAGRSPLDRAIGIDVRLALAVVSYIVFLNLLAGVSHRVHLNIIRLQLIVGTVIALFGVAQYASFTILGSKALTGFASTNEAYRMRTNFFSIGGERVFRASSFFAEPSYFGFYLVPLIVKSLAMRSAGLGPGGHTTQNIVVVILLAGFLVNFSFTAIISLTLVGLVLAIASLRSPSVAIVKYAAAAVILITAILLSPLGGPFLDRLGDLVAVQDLSSIDRFIRAYTGWRVFVDHPWFGVGPGGFAFLYPALGLFVERNLMHTPLNLWLTVLTDVGLVGSLPLVAFLARVIGRGMVAARRITLARVALWSVASYLILLTSVDLWFLDLFWFELALLVVVSRAAVPEFLHE